MQIQNRIPVWLALAAVTLASAALLSARPALSDNMYRAAPQTITVFAENLPHDFFDTKLALGLLAVESERLGALGVDIVKIRLSPDVDTDIALDRLQTDFPKAGFELFEDLEIEEAGMDLSFD